MTDASADLSKRIVITGATGLIGTSLYCKLNSGPYSFTILSRNPDKAKKLFPDAESHIQWPGPGTDTLKNALEGAYAVINLAGASLFGHRWTKRYKAILRESRIQNTAAISGAIAACEYPPALFISSSAVGFYGDTADISVDESSPKGEGFLADLCSDWEQAALQAESKKTRVAIIRTGLVLSKDGGVFKQILTPSRMGLGAWFGNGRQYFPWIHIKDWLGIVKHILDMEDLKGIFNATAPGIVTNKEFTKALGKALRRPAILPVPAFILKIVLGEFAGALLGGQKAIPSQAVDSGYTFVFPELGSALSDLL